MILPALLLCAISGANATEPSAAAPASPPPAVPPPDANPSVPPTASAPPAPTTPAAEPDPVKTVHWTEVKIKVKVIPDYPPEAAALGEARCPLYVTIDARGVPLGVVPKACPEALQETAIEAMMKWRFYPLKVGGAAIPARFLINLVYKPRAEPISPRQTPGQSQE